ncbi:MAG: DUF3604 domain-containing protein [Gemmatimonadetes bacterium]|nr:DUF3604 domain-containing protein [Gemmatimonadota bacterium]
MRVSRTGMAFRLALVLALSAVVGCGGGGGGQAGGGAESAPEAANDDTPLAERGTFLHIVVPSVVEKGANTEVRLRVLTQAGLPDYDFEGAFRIQASSPQTQFPEEMVVEPMQEGWFRVQDLVFPEGGVQYIKGSVPGDTVEALANAFNVVESPEYNIYWGDLNGHTDLSSGVKAPGVYFWFARAVALLDFVALTDNDAEETLQKVMDDVAFADIATLVDEEKNDPGSFVAMVGMEWTSREYGNRLVYFSETPETLPSVAAGYDTPAKLRAALPPGSVVAVPHPSGSALNPPVDPASLDGEELVEVYSSVGSFEMAESLRPATQETAGSFANELLAAGHRVGFLGNSDTRLSTPGNPRGFTTDDHPYPGGLTAVLAKELTRESILEALRERRTYATTGVRYLMEFTVDGQPMGSEIRVPRGHEAKIYGSLGSTSRWTRMEFLGPDGAVKVLTPEGDDADVVELEATTPPVNEPTYVYLRGVDEFGGMCWSSPVFLLPE